MQSSKFNSWEWWWNGAKYDKSNGGGMCHLRRVQW